MFGNKKSVEEVTENYSNNTDDATIISANTRFEGKINSSGIMRVDGSINGVLNTKGYVIVGENGSIKNTINTNRITIAGVVEGTVQCNGVLEMAQSGVLNGDIEVGSLSIEDGAVFNGKCKMMKKQVADR